MRIVESRGTALTLRHPGAALETATAVAPMASRPAAPVMRSAAAGLAHHTTPDAGFVMQLIATAAADAEADPPPRAAGAAYGRVDGATRPPRSGDRIVRSI